MSASETAITSTSFGPRLGDRGSRALCDHMTAVAAVDRQAVAAGS
jgi:hypothetical protein